MVVFQVETYSNSALLLTIIVQTTITKSNLYKRMETVYVKRLL